MSGFVDVVIVGRDASPSTSQPFTQAVYAGPSNAFLIPIAFTVFGGAGLGGEIGATAASAFALGLLLDRLKGVGSRGRRGRDRRRELIKSMEETRRRLTVRGRHGAKERCNKHTVLYEPIAHPRLRSGDVFVFRMVTVGRTLGTTQSESGEGLNL